MISKKISQAYLIAFIAIFISAFSPQCFGNDVLRFRVAAQRLDTRTYDYWSFSTASRTIQPGDCVEYDVYINCRAPGVGGIDIRNTDGTYWRYLSGWEDQNGIPGHPHADLSAVACKRWYHRKLAVPPAAIGKIISRWDVAVDGYYGSNAILSAQYDNIRITNGGSTVLTVYESGTPDFSASDFYRGSNDRDFVYGPIRLPRTQVGTFFFYWYDAPYNNADPNQMPYHPYGLIGNPWIGYNNGYYSILNQYWWEAEFQDMRRAGVDFAALICWGNNNSYFNTASVASYMIPALDRSGCGIKIAMFDDTTSECCEWNVAQGRSYYPHVKMPLSDTNNWRYFYDLKIKPFFQAVPQKYWATHNGLPVEQGGRPIIITYTCQFFDNVSTHGNALWQWIKNRFAEDFKDSFGRDIVPWLVHETSWFTNGAGDAADGRYSWGGAISANSYTVGNYRVSNIGPGYDDRWIRSPGTVSVRLNDGKLIGAYNWENPHNSDLLMLETWNELWEGTAIQRCYDYPNTSGGYLPETFYIDTTRKLVSSSIGLRELDATFLRTWEFPSPVKRGSVQTVVVRNDGFNPWTAGEFSLGARLLNSSTGQVIPGTEVILQTLPKTVYSGDECAISFNIPTAWPSSTTYTIQFDMLQGNTWFESIGDKPVSKSINFNPSDVTNPSRPASLTATPGEKSIQLNWRTPTTSDFKCTVIRMSTSSYPTSISSGTLVVQKNNSPNVDDSYKVENLTPGVTYYFSAWSQDRVGNWSSTNRQASAVPLADQANPGPVSDISASFLSTSVAVLSWKNPSDADLNGVMIRWSNTNYPSSPADGSRLCVLYPEPSSKSYFVHEKLVQGKTYYYSFFAFDNDGKYSQARTFSLYVPVINCGSIKLLNDGLEGIELQNKVVTAVFASEGNAYIEEPDRSSGIKFVGNVSGLAPGDRVSVAGTIGTYKPDGATPSERFISGTISKLSSGTPLKPLAMNCKAVGGAAILPNMPGVANGVGLNNIGLLAKISGRVTLVLSNIIYVDDGSGIVDINNRNGVMVTCPGVAPYQVGDVVSVTGIIQGSVPLGWSTNRRHMRARTWDDIQLIYRP